MDVSAGMMGVGFGVFGAAACFGCGGGGLGLAAAVASLCTIFSSCLIFFSFSFSFCMAALRARSTLGAFGTGGGAKESTVYLTGFTGFLTGDLALIILLGKIKRNSGLLD